MADITTIYSESRSSGIPIIGDVSWGTTFCQFHQTRKDVLETFIPYLKAGLENNESCVWITAFPKGELEAALREFVPDLDEHAGKGQLQIVSQREWRAGKEADAAIIARLDAAVRSGFDGLRLAFDGFSRAKGRKTPDGGPETDIIARYNVIAIFAYPRDSFDAIGLMKVVRNHRFALVPNAGRWEVIESSEATIAKDALNRSEEKLRSLFSNMAEGFAYHRIVLDDSGNPCDYVFLEVNDAFERMVGLPAETIIGERVTQALPGIERDPTDWIGKYGKVALTGKPMRFESYSETLKKWYSVSAFSTQKGFFAVTFSDVTDRKAAEQELKDRTVQLEATNRELESFSYSVSHDLRAPLRSMDGFSLALMEDYADKLNDRAKEYLQYIRSSSQLMGRLIDDILSLSRISHADIRFERVNLSALAEEIIADLKRTQPEREILVTISPGLEAFGDRGLLKVAFQNLFGNAFKFTANRKDGRVEFGVMAGSEATYFVKDNGVGFDMAYAEKLFKPFQRLHRAEEFPGTGVGLASVQRVIGRLGGRVWAEGEPEKGAAFYFTLREV